MPREESAACTQRLRPDLARSYGRCSLSRPWAAGDQEIDKRRSSQPRI